MHSVDHFLISSAAPFTSIGWQLVVLARHNMLQKYQVQLESNINLLAEAQLLPIIGTDPLEWIQLRKKLFELSTKGLSG